MPKNKEMDSSFLSNFRKKINTWVAINGNKKIATDEVCKIVDPSTEEEEIIGYKKLDAIVIREILSKLMTIGEGYGRLHTYLIKFKCKTK